MLFRFQIAFLVQLLWMSSKYIRISSFGERQVSIPYLAQIVFRWTNQTKNTWFGPLVPNVSIGKLNDQNQISYYCHNAAQNRLGLPVAQPHENWHFAVQEMKPVQHARQSSWTLDCYTTPQPIIIPQKFYKYFLLYAVLGRRKPTRHVSSCKIKFR
jgi:hypothetical protein